jgi:DNA replication protein DnaC
VGKSFLSCCIAKELLDKGYSVLYFSSSQLFDTLKESDFGKDSKENLYTSKEDIYNCDLVVIDDLGTELTNSYISAKLFSLLNERILRGKSTIISTNLSLMELRDLYSDRIFSRISTKYKLCKLSGPDIRIYKKTASIRK